MQSILFIKTPRADLVMSTFVRNRRQCMSVPYIFVHRRVGANVRQISTENIIFRLRLLFRFNFYSKHLESF